jgi:hypothetical protein
VIDLSLDPIADAAGLAALYLMLREQSKGSKKVLDVRKSGQNRSTLWDKKTPPLSMKWLGSSKYLDKQKGGP